MQVDQLRRGITCVVIHSTQAIVCAQLRPTTRFTPITLINSLVYLTKQTSALVCHTNQYTTAKLAAAQKKKQHLPVGYKSMANQFAL